MGKKEFVLTIHILLFQLDEQHSWLVPIDYNTQKT